MVKVAKSIVADQNTGPPAFQLCYSLEVALNRLSIGGIGSEKKSAMCWWRGDASPSSPPLDPPLGMSNSRRTERTKRKERVNRKRKNTEKEIEIEMNLFL